MLKLKNCRISLVSLEIVLIIMHDIIYIELSLFFFFASFLPLHFFSLNSFDILLCILADSLDVGRFFQSLLFCTSASNQQLKASIITNT